MSLTIHCDHVDDDFRRCEEELTGMAFDAKPKSWTVVLLGHGDHRDYCPAHAPVPPELPEKANGYPVVAICENCREHLTLWSDYRRRKYLAHVSNLENRCSIPAQYAVADRPVPELGLLHESNDPPNQLVVPPGMTNSDFLRSMGML